MATYDENKTLAKATPEDIAAIIDEIAKGKDPQTKLDGKLIASLIEKMCKGECAIRDILGLDDKQMNGLYAMGYNFYQAGKYDDALKIFRALCLFDQLEPKHWIGMGATLQMLKMYEEAANAYGFAAIMDCHDPRPSFHAAECYIALNDKEKAEAALNSVVVLCEPTPANKPFIDKANAILELMKGK
jgi:type III secretion system low calcium response chaperone LcrH/SycD